MSAHQAEHLRRQAAERPAEAAFARVASIRAGLAQGFLAAQLQKPAAERALESFNRALAESSLAPRLLVADTGAAWGWTGDEDALDSLLSKVLSSAFKLMIAAKGRPHVLRPERNQPHPDPAVLLLDRLESHNDPANLPLDRIESHPDPAQTLLDLVEHHPDPA